MTRKEKSPGPFGLEASIDLVKPGDFVQLRFTGNRFGHTPIIVEIGDPPELGNILVAAHSMDVDYRPLNTYTVQGLRFIHILGAYTGEQEGERGSVLTGHSSESGLV